MGMQGLGGGGVVTFDPNAASNVTGPNKTSVPVAPGQAGPTATGVGALSNDYGATNWGGNTVQTTGLLSNTGGGTLQLTSAQANEMRQMAFGINSGTVSSELQSRWTSFVSDMAANGGAIDANALVQHVLREAYLQNTEDLRFYAEKVKYFNETKKIVREYVQGMRDAEVALKSHLREQGLPLERPADAAAAEQWDGACAAFLSNWASTHPTNPAQQATASIYNLAQIDSAEVCVGRAEDLVQQTYGTGLPDEIKSDLVAALSADPKNEEDIKAALRQVAGYVSYLGDCACENGQFPGYGKFNSQRGCDDAQHLDGAPSFEDFEYYKTQGHATDDLAAGDARIIEAAFGLPENTLGGNSDFETIVNLAMSPIGDRWKNDVLYGANASTQEATEMMAAGNFSAPVVPELFANEAEAKEWYNGHTTGLDELTVRIFNDLGMPSTNPPRNVISMDGLANEIKKWEEKLNSVGDDAQLANVDLQNMLQKQQQTLQMMSNISKMLYDTAMAVVRKIGG